MTKAARAAEMRAAGGNESNAGDGHKAPIALGQSQP